MLSKLLRWARITKAGTDDKQFAVQQMEYLGKVSDGLIVFPYGIHANVPPDALALMFAVQGNADNRAAIAWTPKIRPQLKATEVAFYHPKTGALIKWDENGNLEITTGDGGTKDIVINCKKATLNASESATINTDAATINATTSVDVTTTTATISASGSTSLTTPTLTVNCPSSMFTGAVTVGGLLTWAAGMTGSGGSGASVSGNITVAGGNVVADGIGLKTHIHNQGNDSSGDSQPPTGTGVG